MVITVVYRFNIAAERFKGFNIAFVGQEGQPHLAQSVVSLEPGENKSVVFEGVAHHFGDLMGNAGGNGGLQLLQSFGNEAAGFGGVELRSIEAAGVVNHAGSVKKAVSSNPGLSVASASWSKSFSYNEPKAALNARYERRSPTVSAKRRAGLSRKNGRAVSYFRVACQWRHRICL